MKIGTYSKVELLVMLINISVANENIKMCSEGNVMNGISIELRAMRDAAGISQEMMASILGVTQGMVSQYESEPKKVSYEVVEKWNKACGEMVNDRGLSIDDPRSEMISRVEFIENYLAADPLPVPDYLNHELPVSPSQFIAGAKHAIRKPRIGVFGKFDAGKSRLLNSILGGSNMPTSYQPSTSIVCLVRHINDKPEWQAEDVWIYKTGFDMSKADDMAHCLEHRLYSGGYDAIRQYGNHSSQQRSAEAACATVYVDAPFLLASDLVDLPGYGNSDDDKDRAEMAQKTVDAVIYMSQTTGFMGGEDINYLGALMRTLPVYDFDCENAQLKNIFVVASHAHIASAQDRSEILSKAAKRCASHLEKNIKERLYGFDSAMATALAISSPKGMAPVTNPVNPTMALYGFNKSLLSRMFGIEVTKKSKVNIDDFDVTVTPDAHLAAPSIGNQRKQIEQGEVTTPTNQSDDLSGITSIFEKRFFFFSADNFDIREPLFNELTEFATKTYPAFSFAQLNGYMTTAKAKAKGACQSWINELSHALNEREAAQEEIEKIRKNAPELEAMHAQREKRIYASIANYASASEGCVQNSFNQKCTVTAIEETIKARYDNKKDAQQLAASYIMNNVQDEVNDFVRFKSTELSSEVDDYLGKFSAEINCDNLNTGGFSFDARMAFMSALSGVGTVGALGVWASIVAGGSNLGAYILIGKIVGWLSSIGISLGGSAAVAAFVSSIGGPITLAIAAGIAMALGVFGLFGDSWETKLAKKIASEITKQNFRTMVSDGVKKYWYDTETAFRTAIDETKKEYKQKLIELETLAFSTNPEQIRKQIAYGEALRDFFAGIPWRSTKS